jgi:hypothetical protein
MKLIEISQDRNVFCVWLCLAVCILLRALLNTKPLYCTGKMLRSSCRHLASGFDRALPSLLKLTCDIRSAIVTANCSKSKTTRNLML